MYIHITFFLFLSFWEKPKCQGKQKFWSFYPIPSVLLYRCLLYSKSQFAHYSEKIRQSVCQTTVRSCSSRSLQQIQEVYSPPWLIESILFNQWPGQCNGRFTFEKLDIITSYRSAHYISQFCDKKMSESETMSINRFSFRISIPGKSCDASIHGKTKHFIPFLAVIKRLLLFAHVQFNLDLI